MERFHDKEMIFSESKQSVPPSVYTFTGFSEDEQIDRRFRHEKPVTHIIYEFTRDPGYLQQYYRLRQEMFISVWGLKHFEGQEDKYDRNSHILVARHGNLVVGGIRLILRDLQPDGKLPSEGDDFSFDAALPDLDLPNCRVAELCRLAVLPDYRVGEKAVTFGLIRHIRDKINELKLHYTVVVAPLAQLRNYRTQCAPLNQRCVIRMDAEVPDRECYEGIRMAVGVFPMAESEHLIKAKAEAHENA